MPHRTAINQGENARIKSALHKVQEAITTFYASRRTDNKNLFRINQNPDRDSMYYKASFTGVPRTCLIRYNRHLNTMDLFLKQATMISSDDLIFSPETIRTIELNPQDELSYQDIVSICTDWLKPKRNDNRLTNQPRIPALPYPGSLPSANEVSAARINRGEFMAANGSYHIRLFLETDKPGLEAIHDIDEESSAKMNFETLGGHYLIVNAAGKAVILDDIRYNRYFYPVHQLEETPTCPPKRQQQQRQPAHH